MKRVIVWGLLALALLAVLGSAWFLANFDLVPVSGREPPGREARANPYLALERFLAAQGRPLTRSGDPRILDAPPGGVLILDAGRRAHLTPARVEALLAWVAAGGYLIITPDLPGEVDPILSRFDVDCSCKAKPAPAEGDAPAPRPARPTPLPRAVEVAVPGAPRPLRVDADYANLAAGKRAPEWRAGAPGFPEQILHYAEGRGQVTVLYSLGGLFANGTIGHQDHAELLWTLLQTYAPEGRPAVVLLTRFIAPSLVQRLLESAWMPLLAGATLLVLWLWRRIPRFGPVRPDPQPDRRRLGEHLRGVGRYVWRAGGLDVWLAVARESFRTRLALRQPALATLPPAEQAVALAELTGRPASLVAAALQGQEVSPQSFLQALRLLRSLERQL